VISTLNYTPTANWETFKEISAPIADPGKNNDLYFVFKKEGGRDLCNLDWLEFKK
jgi:hypothetical protein